jgi:predicted sulfurtransferase
MKAKSKKFSFYAWLTSAAPEKEAKVKSVHFCASCRLPLDKLQSIFVQVTRAARCQLCRAMIAAADTPYFKAVQEDYQEEQKRKKILMLGGNYLS